MFGSHISRRTVKSVNFMTRKQYFISLLAPHPALRATFSPQYGEKETFVNFETAN